MLVHTYLTVSTILMVLRCYGKDFPQATCQDTESGPTGSPDLEGIGMLQTMKTRNKTTGSSEIDEKMLDHMDTTESVDENKNAATRAAKKHQFNANLGKPDDGDVQFLDTSVMKKKWDASDPCMSSDKLPDHPSFYPAMMEMAWTGGKGPSSFDPLVAHEWKMAQYFVIKGFLNTDWVQLYQKGKECSLIFAGTNDASDMWTNLKIFVKQTGFSCNNALVHKGFYEELARVLNAPEWPKMQEFMSGDECSAGIYAAGHSLGGAMASIFTACVNAQHGYLKDNPFRVKGLYTWGAPAITRAKPLANPNDECLNGARFFIEDGEGGRPKIDPVPHIPSAFGWWHPKIAAVRLEQGAATWKIPCTCTEKQEVRLWKRRRYAWRFSMHTIYFDRMRAVFNDIPQKWKIGRIMWAHHPNCMDVAGGDTNRGANLQAWGCPEHWAHTNRRFMVKREGHGPIKWYTHQNKCVDVNKGKTENGVNIHLWDCDPNNPNQQWIPPATGTGPIKWATHPSKCIDVSGGGKDNGVNLQIWDCVDNHPNMQWKIMDERV